MVAAVLLLAQLGKLAFLAWCMYPSRKNNGSVIVYEHIVRKFLVKHEQVSAGLALPSPHRGDV